MRRPRATSTRLAAVVATTAAVTTACAVGHASTLSVLSGPSGRPITVGISLPLYGPQQAGGFGPDGQASQRGYELWASDVNSHGGLLGRPVRLVFRNDKGDPKLTQDNYVTLIKRDRVNLTLAPFSSLLTIAAAQTTNKLGYALAAGSASAPGVYGLHYRSLFSTNVPVAAQLVPLARWIQSLPHGQRPATAAYAMVNDPFADPPVQAVQGLLTRAGIKTVFSNTSWPKDSPSAGYTKTSTAALEADARQVASKNADMMVLGSVAVPTVAAFIHEFSKLHYQPKIFLATSGPDQGQAFLNAIGTGNAEGVMVPNGWYGAYPNPLSHAMVQDYIAKYGGSAADINADVAEAYSAGEVLAYAVQATHSLSQHKLINYLHSGVNLPTVVGSVRFNGYGEDLNAVNSAVIFQWQSAGSSFVPVLPHTFPGVQRIIYPKPHWSG
jgi:branched-chain amino acid transport system substrate-binding protein